MIRTAHPDDAALVAEAHIRSWQAAYRDLLPEEMLDGLSDHLPERTRRWRATIEAHPTDVRVALLDGSVVGFSRIARCRDEDHGLLHAVGEVQSIYLREEAWGRGLGRQLMSESEAALRQHRFTSACLWVLEANVRARRFYAAAGWNPDGTEKEETHSGQALHEVRYRKKL